MTIRSGIDGRSRLATFLEAGSDNKSISSLDSFMNGVRRYGVPSHTRTDKGGENVLIARFMLTARGLNAHFTGRSVHNHRSVSSVPSIFQQILHDRVYVQKL